MSVLPGVTIIVAGADSNRFHAALSLAAANAALGERSRVFLQGEAASLLTRSGASALDSRLARHGIPTVPDLLGECLAMGVEIIACQSGLALAGISAEALPAGSRTGGLVEVLASRGEDQLLMA